MIIDSHQHVFWHGRDDKGLIADMDEHGIDVAWLLTWNVLPEEDARGYHRVLNPVNVRADGTHEGIPLRDLIITRDRYPDRFVLGYCPHPQLGNAPELFEAGYHIHGVRVCAEWKFRMLFDDPRCLQLYRKAGELKCPVVLHLDVPYLTDDAGTSQFQSSWYGGTVDNLERALQACPETTFVGHAPGFWREISGNADQAQTAYPKGEVTPGGKLYRLFDQYPNLVADLSAGSALRALNRDPGHAVEFLDRYQDRLMFARDYYGGELHAFLQSLDLSQTILDKLYCDNALKLVPLDGVAAATMPVKTLT